MQFPSMFLILTSHIILLLNFPFSISSCICHEPNYTTGSTFQSNLEHLLADLPRNAAANNYTYNTTYGKAPDQVYGLAMCYADASLSTCNGCLSEVSARMTACCALRKRGDSVNNACVIAYSDTAFNASNDFGAISSESKSANNQKLADPQKFIKTLQQLTGDLAANASKSPLRMEAGATDCVPDGKIYTLVQCTRQLPADECTRCIHKLTAVGVENLMRDDSVFKDQTTIRTLSCYVRYALHPFYVISDAHPPWTNTGKQSRELIPTHIFTIVIVALLLLVAHVPSI